MAAHPSGAGLSTACFTVAPGVSFLMMKRWVFLLLVVTLMGCETYPTIDIRTEKGIGSSAEKELRSIITNLGFVCHSDARKHCAHNKDKKTLLFLTLGKESLKIRIISHSGNVDLTQSLGEQLKAEISSKYPELELRFKYFDQTSWFS